MLLLTHTRADVEGAAPATDLGYLAAKHPDRAQEFDLRFGRAHVFYPEATPERCSLALLLDIDPVGLVRGRGSGEGLLDAYVNDRPYVASSFLSVALARVFRSAMSGQCRELPALPLQRLPLRAFLPAVPCRGSEEFLRGLWEPLGYEVNARRLPLDEQFPDWGESSLWELEIAGTVRLSDLLSHLYVLLPVLDDEKHYFVGEEEVEKLLRRGGVTVETRTTGGSSASTQDTKEDEAAPAVTQGWLQTHPLREEIVTRYLQRRRKLTREALARLMPEDPDAEERSEQAEREEEAVEKKVGLHDQRLQKVAEELKACGARSVLDLGCGEGKLMTLLLKDAQFERVVGVDASVRALEIARRHLDRLAARAQERATLLHGALTYRDARWNGFDAAALVEVVEHLDPPRLRAFERAVWEFAHPRTVVLTTPNRDYNVTWESLPEGKMRHRDHRFEWNRAEFQAWAQGVAERSGYDVRFADVGPVVEELGAPTQMAVFERV